MKLAPAWIVAGVLATLLALGQCRQDPDVAVALDRAATAEAAIPMLVVQRDSMARANLTLAVRSDSIAQAYVDSAAVWGARRADAQARAAEATLRASSVATQLVAQLDSTEAAMFSQYEAARDSIDAAFDVVIDGLEAERGALLAERTLLYAQVAGLQDELVAERAISRQLRTANEALHDALRESEPSLLGRIGDFAEKGLAAKALVDMARGG